jgi:chemotaxis protein histidine kinase CheA
MSQEQATAALGFLRSRFLTGLTGRVREMHVTIDLLAAGRGEDGAEETLARLFHSLAGIGGTYGFPEITFLAHAGEEACVAGERRDGRARVALLRAVVNAIDAAGSGVPAAVHTNVA